MGNGSATGCFALIKDVFGHEVEKLLAYHFGILFCI
jgi:hypothetical protein